LRNEAVDHQSIDRRNIQDVAEIYSQEGDHKETDNLYEEMDDPRQDYENSQKDYDDVMNGPREEKQNSHPRQAVNEFRICYSRPKFPRRNLTTERLAQPKKKAMIANPFLYSDFRGMLHADYQEALENIDIVPYAPSMSRPFTPNDGFQTGLSQGVKSTKNFSENFNEMSKSKVHQH
jgi:hypothetical protein